jgi:hypothetical protein
MLIGFSCIDMVAFNDLAHFGCDAYKKKHMRECGSHHIQPKRHYQGMV